MQFLTTCSYYDLQWRRFALIVQDIQSNLGFRTSRSSNNSVFERKIRDENHSVLKQKFGSQTTQEKDLPEPKRQRIEKTPLLLSEVFMEKNFPSKK